MRVIRTGKKGKGWTLTSPSPLGKVRRTHAAPLRRGAVIRAPPRPTWGKPQVAGASGLRCN
jgi:hypothetical protein